MDAHDFLKALSIVMTVAAVTTVLFQRLKQPVVLGYILAGFIVGPHVPIPLVADQRVVHTLSELGVILLMFSLGLEFSLRKLAKVGPTAGLTAVVQCSLMLWLGYLAGQWLGWTDKESLFIGAALAVSSTTIIAKAFEEQKVGGKLKDLVVGILIVEDLISILLMAALTAVSNEGGVSTETLFRAGGRLTLFLVVLLLVGLLVVPKPLRAVVKLGRPETILVASIGVCFVFALAAMEAGYSVALGAFLAGSVVAESGRERIIGPLVQPVRDMFAAVFFVSVGMMLNPALVAKHWGAIALLTGLVVVGKVLSVMVGGLLTGNGVRTSTQAGMSLAQIGEFSFIIAGLGLTLKATGGFLYPVVVAVSIVTTLLTPAMIRVSGPVSEWVDRILPKPLQTFAALYASWTERLAANPQRGALSGRVWSLSKLLLLDALAILVVVAMSAGYVNDLTALLASWLNLGAGPVRSVLLILTVLACLPFFFAIVKVTRALGAALAGSVFPARAEGELDLSVAPRRAMVTAVQLIITLLVGLPLLALTQPLLRGWVGPVVMLSLLGFLAWSFWRHATDLQGHVRAGSAVLAETLSERLLHPRASSGVLVPTELPGFMSGLGDPVAVCLPSGCAAEGRSLAQLKLRGATGATVLAVIGADGQTRVPQAGQTLAAGDTLVLAGTRPAIEAAHALLGVKPGPDQPKA